MNAAERSRVQVRVAGLAAALLILAGCGGSASAAGNASPTARPPAAGASTATVALAGSSALGAHLVDQAGRSLYLLTKDSANTTTCTATCVASWPAFEVAGSGTVAAGDGVTGALATLTRSDDGNRQVTYNGVPLYYFGGDSKAGDTNGQGLGGVWFLAGSASTAQGGRISGGVGEGTASGGAATGAPPASPASGGY